MKKLYSLILAFLLLGSGLAFAVAIPEGEDAQNGPAVWLVPVYNNSGSSLSAGDVVIWDIDSSTGDDDNYVTTTTTADTVLVAGVVYRNTIAAASNGTIAIRGVVPVNMQTNGGGSAVKGPLCTSTTAGKAKSCATDGNKFGIVTTVVSSGSVNAFVSAL